MNVFSEISFMLDYQDRKVTFSSHSSIT